MLCRTTFFCLSVKKWMKTDQTFQSAEKKLTENDKKGDRLHSEWNKRLYHQGILFTLQSRKQTIGNKRMKMSILKTIFQVKNGIERMTVADGWLSSFWSPALILVFSLGDCLSSSCRRWFVLSAFPSVAIQC